MLGYPQRRASRGCPLRAIPFVVEENVKSVHKEQAMTYLLQIYNTTAMEQFQSLSDAEREAITEEYMAIGRAPGVKGGHQLQGPETATTVRVQAGSTLTTDGPFAETKEVIGGYYLFDADDLDAAIEMAARIPAARMGGAIEVRPIVER
jgi:hypothetical protein